MLLGVAPADAQVGTQDATPDAARVRLLIEVDPRTEAEVVNGLDRELDLDIVGRFETSNYLIADVSAADVEAVNAAPGIANVVVDQVATRALDSSVGITGAPARWADGHRGAGTVVVVVDDGVSSAHPNLSGKVVAEACFTQTGCGGGSGSAVGPGTGQPCAFCTHGTHVAGVAAGRGSGLDGVAPDASLFAIRVFESASGSAYFSDIARALEHVLARADHFDIAAVNLSVQGTDPFPGTCDNEHVPLANAIHALAARGIPTIVASGNRGFTTGMPLPACISGTVSVGSHADNLTVATSSNAGPLTSILAPGVSITSPNPPNGFTTVSGTSFAAPHVAGAYALWRDTFPDVDPAEMFFLSTATGQQILDPRNGLSYPRLFLDDPYETCSTQFEACRAFLPAGRFVPTIESVSGTYRPVVGDFDGSETDDIFWYAPGSALDFIWNSTDPKGFSSRVESVQGRYRVAVLDQNGDGRDDLLFHGPGPALDSLWFGRADGGFDKTNLSLPGDYALLVGDFDGDTIDDVFLYEAGRGADGLIRGGVPVVIEPFRVTGSYEPLVADFDDDDIDDLFWYAAGPRPDYVWYGGPSGFASTPRPVGGSYQAFVGDFGGGPTDDIFWYAPGPAPDYVWRGDAGRGAFSSTATSVSGSYAPTVLDADGVGGDEILWYADGVGADHLWTFAGTTRSSRPAAAGDGGVVVPGRFDAAGADDLFFYRPGSSKEPVWYSVPG